LEILKEPQNNPQADGSFLSEQYTTYDDNWNIHPLVANAVAILVLRQMALISGQRNSSYTMSIMTTSLKKEPNKCHG